MHPGGKSITQCPALSSSGSSSTAVLSSGNVSGKSKKKKKRKKKKKSQKANETANREVNNAEEEMNDGGETSEPQVEWEYYNLALQFVHFKHLYVYLHVS